MPYIGKEPEHGNYQLLDALVDSSDDDFDGSITTFLLTADGVAVYPTSPTTLIISLGGVIQEPNTTYTVSGNQITFTTAPATSTTFFGVSLGDTLDIGTPSDDSVDSQHYVDGSIDSAHIADDAVTYAKMQNLGTADRVLGSASTGVIGEVQIVPDMLATNAVTNVKVATGIDAIKLADGSVTNTELQYINSLSSNAQTQLAAKHVTIDSSARLDASLIGANGNVSNTEYGYLNGVTSAIQTQIDAAGGTSVAGTTDNAILTFVNSGSTFTAEANLQFDGTHFGIGSGMSLNHALVLHQTGTADADGMTFQNSDNSHHMRLKLDSSNNFVLNNAGNGGLTIDGVGKIRTTSAIFMGDTANENNTKGLTINLGSSDNHYLTFKGDISSGLDELPSRSDVETDDMVVFEAEANSTAGGLRITTVTDGGSVAFSVHTFSDSDPGATKSDSTGGTMTFVAHKKDSNADTEGTWADNSNIFTIRVEDDTDDAVRFIFDSGGNAYADEGWGTYSDGRLKFDQEVLPYGLNEVMQLQPKLYNRDSGYLLEDGTPVLEGKRRSQIGFVAQEVMAVIPELVKPLDTPQSWYSLDDGKLSALLVSAVQELNNKHEARLNELQAEIDILKGN